MRAILLLASAIALAACGPGESSAETATADPEPITVAQNDAASDDAAGAESGPDLSGLPEAYQAADLANGRQNWFLCAACHQVADGSSHAVGPDLYGIFGQTAAANETFPLYSPGLQESGIVWTPETMDTWFANPRDVIPSTTMIFPGIRDADDRRDLIAWLWVETGAADSAGE